MPTEHNEKPTRFLLVGLRARFFTLLLLLAAASMAPWAVTRPAESNLRGQGLRVDFAGSLRYRIRTIEHYALTNATPHRNAELQKLIDDQRRTLEVLLRGDSMRQVRHCEHASVCDRLRAHQDRWNNVIAPALQQKAPAAEIQPMLAAEFDQLNETVHIMAALQEDAVARIARVNLYAGIGSLAALVLVSLGIWTVFARIRKLREAAATPNAEQRVRSLAGGHDELDELARSLADSLTELRTRTRRMSQQQRAINQLALDVSFAESLASLSALDSGAGLLGAGLQALVPHDVAVLSLFGDTGTVTQTWEIAGGSARASAQLVDLPPPLRPTMLCGDGLQSEVALDRFQLAGALLVPLRVEARPVALLVLGRLSTQFDARSVEVAEGFAAVLATTVSRLQLEAQLRLSHQFAAIGGFGRLLAHQMRNPLNGMHLQAELLERQLRKLPVTSEALASACKRMNAIRGEIERLDALVKEYGAIAATEGFDGFAAVDLREVIREAVSDFDDSYGDLDVDLQLLLGDDAAIVSVDRERLIHAVRHLVANAVEAMVSGEHRSLAIELRRVDEPWSITVSDSGPGLRDPDRIFSPGYTTKNIGAGMGLPVTLQIAQLHGGTVVARQRQGGGAEFVLSIPTEPKAAITHH